MVVTTLMMSAPGTKRTNSVRASMSASDPSGHSGGGGVAIPWAACDLTLVAITFFWLPNLRRDYGGGYLQLPRSQQGFNFLRFVR
jgi:hypothetical protein